MKIQMDLIIQILPNTRLVTQMYFDHKRAETKKTESTTWQPELQKLLLLPT